MCAVSRPLLFASPVSRRSIRIWLGQTDQWQPSVITLIPQCFNKTQPNFQQSRSWVEQGAGLQAKGLEKKELSLSFIFSSATMERCNNDQYLATLCVVTALRRMSRSPGLMGSIDVRQRERVTQFTGQRHAMSGIRGSECDCCDIPLMSPEGWVSVTTVHYHGHYDQCSMLSTRLQRVLTLIYFHNLNLECYLVQQQSLHCHPQPTAPCACSCSGWTQIVWPDTEVMG